MNDLDQLGRIFSILGTPTKETWPGATELPNYVEFDKTEPEEFEMIFQAVDKNLVDLLSKLLVLDPNKRISLDDALDHHFFTESPNPCLASEIPLPLKI